MPREGYSLRAKLDLIGSLDSVTADEIIATVAMIPMEVPVVIDVHQFVSIDDAALEDLARTLTLACRPVLFQGVTAHRRPLPGYTLVDSLSNRN